MIIEVWARRPMKYSGSFRSRGAIFDLNGQRNDEKLLRLGFVRKLTAHEENAKVQCGTCQQWFIGRSELVYHGKLSHRDKEEVIRPTSESKVSLPTGSRMDDRLVGGVEDDTKSIGEERRLNEIAPLYLENTKASRESGENITDITSEAVQAANAAKDIPQVTHSEEVVEVIGPEEVRGASPRRNRKKKKTSKKKNPVSKKKTGRKRGRPRLKPIVEENEEEE